MSLKSLAKNCFRSLPTHAQHKVASLYVKHRLRTIADLKTPTVLIYFVTSRCNARCAHCFYWQNLNQAQEELTIEQIEKIAVSLKHPVHLSLTGGEPLLRKDLAEIGLAFNRQNGCRNIGLATNGFLVDETEAVCHKWLKDADLDSLSVQVSLDGLEATHNRIRGVRNGYQKAMDTIRRLAKLAKAEAQFSIAVSITVQDQNISEVADIVKNLQPYQVPVKFALVRGQNYGTYCLPPAAANEIDPQETDAPVLDMTALDNLFQRLKKMNDEAQYKFWSTRQQEKIRLSLAMMRDRERQLPCYAGKIDAVLYANGDVALCELTREVGNLRDFDYNMESLWRSQNADKVRRLITKCYCIHGCNLTTSMTLEPKIVASKIAGS